MDENEYLYAFGAMILMKEVQQKSLTKSSGLSQFASILFHQFNPETQLKGVSKLLKMIDEVPLEAEESDSSLIDYSNLTSDILSSFRLDSLDWIQHLLSAKVFFRNREINDSLVLELVEQTIVMLDEADANDGEYNTRLASMLTKLTSLLDLEHFTSMVSRLLARPELVINKNAVRLLTKRIENLEKLDEEVAAIFKETVSLLVSIVSENKKDSELRQISFLGLAVLARKLAAYDAEMFTDAFAVAYGDRGMLAKDAQMVIPALACLNSLM